MQKTTFLLILVAALGIGSVLYLMGGSVPVEAEPVSYSFPRKSYTPFEEHVKEGIGQGTRLAEFLEDLDQLRARRQALAEEANSHDAHVEAYFQTAEAEANQIQDSSLKQVVLHQLQLEKDSLAFRSLEWKNRQSELAAMYQKAEDLGRAVKVLASTGSFSKWTKENHPAAPELERLARDYQKLLDDFKAESSAI